MVVGITPGLSKSLNEGASICPANHAHSYFETIFLEHYGRVLRLLARLVGNRTQGEDLANEVFWKLSQQSEHWLQTNNVGGWLYRTAIHAGIDALRASSHRKQYELAATLHLRDHEPGPLKDMLREEDRQNVQIVLGAMKPAQAQLLLMRADGASYKELAEALNVAISGVGTLLNRAEAEFRKRYWKLIEKRNPL